jgi:ribosomal-protein-alanine N-acetyltransferase
MSPNRRAPRGLSRALAIGERVFLRRMSAADEAEYLELLRASLAFHRRWSPAPPPGVDPAGPPVFRRALLGGRRKNAERMLLCRRDDGALVGSINLSEIVRGVFQSAFLGYWIGAEHKRVGYMTEGLQLALGRAFGPLGLHRLEANIQPRNAASIALVRRAGFRFEGLARRYLKIDGAWRDHEHWAILAEDWRKLQRRRKA